MTTQTTELPSQVGFSVSSRVLEAISEAERTDPLDLDGRLYDEIDPDALDALYRDGRSAVAVEFTYLGYRVSIDPRGEVSVQSA